MTDLYPDLKKRIDGEVRFDKVSRQIYSTDASMYQIEPVGVVIPRHAEDVEAAAEIARKYVVPVLPRGGGTSLAGQCVGDALMIDMGTHMNQVLELNLEEEWVRVQPGVIQDQLNRYLAPHGYGFGPDTSTSNRATIGGMAGNNSSGARSIIYGKTVDHVIEVDAILSDGSRCTFGPQDQAGLDAKLRQEDLEGHIYREVIRIARENSAEVDARYPKILRRVSGYNLDEILKSATPNLASILVGSEGTLALGTSLKVKIVPLPKHKGLLVVHFRNMIEAAKADGPILEHHPSAAELVDRRIMEEAKASPLFQGKTDFLVDNPGSIVVVEFYGESRAEIEDKVEKLTADLKRQKMGYAHVKAIEPSEQALVWNLRKGGLGLLMGTRIDAKPVAFVEDTAVDPLKLPGFLKSFEEVVKKHKTEAGYYGHCSVGCLHIRPFIDLKKPDERKKMMSIFNDITDLVEEYGGSMSGEHGDGLARSWLLKRLFGEKLVTAFQDVKLAFDPNNLMNPGKIVNPADPIANLRLGDFYQNRKIETSLDFSRDGGFNFAIEMCNGNGQCRKLDTGTMCPSYQATRNDRHSTRGRANALRGVIAGSLDLTAYTSPEMYDVMDLCLACKGCKTECPSKVDMAKMKYEFLYHYNKAHGVSARTRMFGNAEGMNKLGCATWPLSSLAMATPLRRPLLKAMGIAPQRKLPPFARQRFSVWFKNHMKKNPAAPGQPKVVLFNDTFMEYNHPNLGKDTVKILERAGFEVVLLKGRKCCGRPQISKGLLDEGRKLARHNVKLLKQYALEGIPIVGVEPSCLLAIKEDYPDLLPGEDTEAVARGVTTIDEFLRDLIRDGKLALGQNAGQGAGQAKSGGKKSSGQKYLLHGHCHQKALVGTRPTLEVLESIPGAEVSEIDSGCCGMAGTFGYEKEHYDVSIQIGEDRLFPAVREAEKGTVLVADGLSCRQQIHHGTKKHALHLVEVIAQALD